jgi:hypothetical protein
MFREALEWNGAILDAIDTVRGFGCSVRRLRIDAEMGRINVELEVERAAAVPGESRLAEPDRMPCFSIAGRTSDAIFVFNAELRISSFLSP